MLHFLTDNITQFNLFTTHVIRPYQVLVNVSDLYVSWSKLAVGLIIHKNDKNLNQLLLDASSMSASKEITQKVEKCKISTTETARTQTIFLMNQN